MRKIFVIVAILLFYLSAGISAVEIVFKNGRPDNANAIESRLKSAADPSFSLLDSLTVDLSKRGYLDAAVTIKSGKLIISSGHQYLLSKIIFVKDSNFEILVNRPFDSIHVSLAIENQLQIFRDSGYFYASCQTKEVAIYDNPVVLTVELNKGPQVKQGELVFAGLNRSDRELVKKYIPENGAGVLTANYVQDIERAASQISFVKFTPPVNLQPRPGYTVSDIVFNFLEKTPVRLNGAAGLGGRDNSDVIWSLGLSFNNLFGQGKQIDLNSERIDSKRKTLNVSYSQPLFLMGLGELGLNVFTRDYRNEFYEFALAASYHTRINKNLMTGVRFGWKSVKPESGNAGYNSYRGLFSISRKTFSEDFNPRHGLALKWDIEFAFRKYTASNLVASNAQAFNETRNNISADIYQPIIGLLLGHLGLHYAGLETSESIPPLSELILIGGPGSLRGYRTDQFAAVRAAYGTIEPRVRFSQGYLFAFYDAAYLNNRIANSNYDIITYEQYRWSYGLGFGLGDGRRSLSLSLGLNPDFGLNEPRLSMELSSDI